MAFGDVVRNANSPSVSPTGIGGDANTIWHCDNNTNDVYELSTVDLSVVRNANSPNSIPTGIGGDANTIWHCDTNTDDVYELSTVDLSVVRNANSPNSIPSGIGGDANTIWHCDNNTNDVYELDPALGWTGKISGVTNPAKIAGVSMTNIAKVKGVV